MAKMVLRKIENPDGTISLYGVDVLDTGIVRGQFRFDLAKLDEIVKNFKLLKGKIKIPVKLGHGDDEITKRSGYPAVGWIENIYRDGTKLFVDVTNIPAKVAQLIELRAYIQKSVELAWNYIDNSGREFGTALLGLAFLGEELPEIKTLDDILGLYEIDRAAVNANFSAVAQLITLSENLDLVTINAKCEGGSIMKDKNKGAKMAEDETAVVVTPNPPAAPVEAPAVPEMPEVAEAKPNGFDEALKQFHEAIESVRQLIAQKSLSPEEVSKLDELRGLIGQLGNFIPTLFSQKSETVKVQQNAEIEKLRVELSEQREANKVLTAAIEKFDTKFSEIEAEKRRVAITSRVDKLVESGKLAPALKGDMVGVIEKIKTTAPAMLTFADGKQADAADAMLAIFEQNETVDLSEVPAVKPISAQVERYEKPVVLSAAEVVAKITAKYPDFFKK